MKSVDIYRPLGAREQIFWLHDQAYPSHFALTAQIKGKFTVSQLQQALNLVQQRHPLLRVRIAVDETEHPWFVKQPGYIPLRVMERQSEQHWQQEVEQEIATPFVWWQAPLVRAILLHSSRDTELSELIVTFHHASADGISGTYLIRDILQAMATSTAFGESLSVPPSLEELMIGITPERASLLKQLPKFISDSLLVEQRAEQDNRSFLSSGSLSPETTGLLIARCRQEQTTVHGAICAAFILAIYQQNPSEQSQNIRCTSPINLRPDLTSANQENVSSCITAERTLHLLNSDANFWEVARSVKHQLQQSMTSNKFFEQMFQLREWLSTRRSPHDALQAFKDQLDYDIAVSNLTRLTIAQQFGELELQAIYGPVLTIGVKHDCLVGVATLGDRLFFTLMCSARVMGRSEAKKLQQRAIHLLNEATYWSIA